MNYENQQDVIVSSSQLLESQTRGEIDVQIATAKAYPRTVSLVTKKILDLATISQDTAESCWYTLPRGGKAIEGPSVRMAEIVAASWGNLRVQSRVVGDDGKIITCQAACIDLETNFAAQVEVKRRVTDKNGRRYNDDMIVTTSNAGCAIAFRNAVFKVVPGALLKDVMGKVKQVAMGDERTLQSKRDAAMAHFTGQGISKERIFGVIEKKDIEDITLEDVAILRGLATAIGEGTTTLEDAFPHTSDPSEKGKKLHEELSKRKSKKPEPTPEEIAESDAKKEELKAKLEQKQRPDAYVQLSTAYDVRPDIVDESLGEVELPCMLDLVWQDLDESGINKLKRAYAKYAKKISE
jgi:hypothetical protein